MIVGPDEKVITIPAGQGRNAGHGPRHTFEMTVLDTAHPITRGLPKHWTQPMEQLTHGQHGPAAGLTVLTYAWSKDVNENEPMDWVRSTEKAGFTSRCWGTRGPTRRIPISGARSFSS